MEPVKFHVKSVTLPQNFKIQFVHKEFDELIDLDSPIQLRERKSNELHIIVDASPNTNTIQSPVNDSTDKNDKNGQSFEESFRGFIIENLVLIVYFICYARDPLPLRALVELTICRQHHHHHYHHHHRHHFFC